MTKFVKYKDVAKSVMSIVKDRVSKAETFPQVYFIPELVYSAVLELHAGNKDLAVTIMKRNSKFQGFSQLSEEILEITDSWVNDGESGFDSLGIVLSNDSVCMPILLDGMKFEEVFLRTLTVYKLPKFIDGAFFGTLPLPTLAELEAQEGDDEELEDEIRKRKAKARLKKAPRKPRSNKSTPTSIAIESNRLPGE